MTVRALTTEQANLLIGQKYDDSREFGVYQDANNGYYISNEEANWCTNPEFLWVKDLPQMTYTPKEIQRS